MELNLVLLNFVIMKSSINFDLPTYYNILSKINV